MIDTPQIVTATAQTLFQRFWFVSSLTNFHVAVRLSLCLSLRVTKQLTPKGHGSIQDTAAGALFLASKLEETPVRMRDIINSFAYLDHLISSSSSSTTPASQEKQQQKRYEPMDYFATEFYDRKDAVVIAEMQILKRLGFHTQSALPYGHLANYCQVLELATNDSQFVRQAWGHLNDMFHTDVPARYAQSTMAAAAIYLVARKRGTCLPLDPVPWWQLFDASEAELVQIVDQLLSLYRDWSSSSPSIWARFAKLPRTKAEVRHAAKVAAAASKA